MADTNNTPNGKRISTTEVVTPISASERAQQGTVIEFDPEIARMIGGARRKKNGKYSIGKPNHESDYC